MIKSFRGDQMYQKCSICGTYSDDGTVRNGKMICHECLDKEDDGKIAPRIRGALFYLSHFI